MAGPTHGARPCRLGTILTNLDPDDRDAVLDALARRTWSPHQISRLLTISGHPVGHSTVYRHRERLCYCPTETTP